MNCGIDQALAIWICCHYLEFERAGWQNRVKSVTGRVNIRSKRGFATLFTMVSCYPPWSKSIREEPFQKLFQLLNHHEKILVMMNFSKKVFPRVTQRYQLKPVPGSLLLPARPLTAISLARKQASPCVWVSLNSTAAYKTIDSCLWKKLLISLSLQSIRQK